MTPIEMAIEQASCLVLRNSRRSEGHSNADSELASASDVWISACNEQKGRRPLKWSSKVCYCPVCGTRTTSRSRTREAQFLAGAMVTAT